MPDALTRKAIEHILVLAYSADELHAAIDRAVDWIEAHPTAGAEGTAPFYTNALLGEIADCIHDRYAGEEGAPSHEDIYAAVQRADEGTLWETFVGKCIDNIEDFLAEDHGLKRPPL